MAMIRSLLWKLANHHASAVATSSFSGKHFTRFRYLCTVATRETDSNLHDLVNQISRILSDHRSPHHDLEHSLTPFSSLLTTSIVEQVLKRCKNLSFASHRFFLWATRIPNFSHSEGSYYILVEVLGSGKQFPLLWDFLFELKSLKDFAITHKLFWSLFRSYSRAGYPLDAIRAFERMSEFQLTPTTDDLDRLIYSLCKRKFVKQAQGYFDMVKHNFEPRTKTYSILVRGWTLIKDTATARKVFDEMLAKHCVADILAYNSLIETFCKSESTKEASIILEEMKSRGIEPDAFTYSIFIRTHLSTNDMNSVYKVLDRMKQTNLTLNTFAYNGIIKSLCKNDRVEEAYRMLDEMTDPDTWSFNTVLAYHCEHGEVNRASKLVASMRKRGCLPDRHSYNMLLKVVIGLGRFDRMAEIWEGMGANGFKPSVSTYAVVLHGLGKKRDKVEEMCRFFEKMVDEGVPPYPETLEMVRNKLLRVGRADDVEVLAGKMDRSNSCSIREGAKLLRGGVGM